MRLHISLHVARVSPFIYISFFEGVVNMHLENMCIRNDSFNLNMQRVEHNSGVQSFVIGK